jgi:hypothetical protein
MPCGSGEEAGKCGVFGMGVFVTTKKLEEGPGL